MTHLAKILYRSINGRPGTFANSPTNQFISPTPQPGNQVDSPLPIRTDSSPIPAKIKPISPTPIKVNNYKSSTHKKTSLTIPPYKNNSLLYEVGPNLLFLTGMYLLVITIFILFFIVPFWKIFKKAGYKGWEALIQGHNIFILFKIIGKPGWWYFFTLIPIVNLGFYIYLIFKLAKSFGRSTLFAILMIFLPFLPICLYILAFGKSQYAGSPLQSSPPTTPIQQNQKPQQQPSNITKVGLLLRCGANAIDMFIFLMVSIPLHFIISSIFSSFSQQQTVAYDTILKTEVTYYIVITGLVIAYFTIFEGISGQTIGKKIVNIQVVSSTGKKISMTQSLLRNALRIIDYILLPLSLFLLSLNKSQRIGDLAAGTYVIKKPKVATDPISSNQQSPTQPQQPPTVV